MTAFVDFGRKTQYSVKNAIGDTKSSMPILKERGQKWFAVSDYGECSGWVSQYFSCKKEGIVPILGMETFVNNYDFIQNGKSSDDVIVKKYGEHDEWEKNVIQVGDEELDWSQIDFPIDIFARTIDGYYNIIQIHNWANINHVGARARTTDAFLKKHGKGIVALMPTPYSEFSSCVFNGEYSMALKKYKFYQSVFDDVYVEIPILEDEDYRAINGSIVRFCLRHGILMVPVVNAHYDESGDQEAFTIYRKCGDKSAGGMRYEVDYADGMYMKTREEVWDTFKKYHESIDFTEDVMRDMMLSLDALCFSFKTLDIDTSPKTPHFENSSEILKEHANAGFVKYGFDKMGDVYKERLDYELDNRCRAGFADYFLLIEQMFDWHVNKMHRIGSVGRGCFAPWVRVRMADGSLKCIETIRKGDMVLSGKGNLREVMEVYSYDVEHEKMSNIGIDNDENSYFACTIDHKIRAIKYGYEVWVEAGELKAGDEVVRYDGSFSVVTDNVFTEYNGKVYDLNVDVDHDYVVENVVVHNSAAGSLVLRCLGVTKIDPIRHNLLFERFLDASRLDDIINKGGKLSGADFPDVDCFTHDTLVLTERGIVEIGSVKEGEMVVTSDGSLQPIEKIVDYRNAPVVRVCYGGWFFDCTPNHRVLVFRDGVCEYKYVFELSRGDELVVSEDEHIPIKDICQERIAKIVRDLKVKYRHCFRVCGRACDHVLFDDGTERYLSKEELKMA